MTDLLSRPAATRPREGRPPRQRPVLATAIVAALWVASLGLCGVLLVVLAAWAADARSGTAASTAARTALQVWLLAQHGALDVPGGRIVLAPLGLTLLLFLLLVRAGRVVGRAARAAGPQAAVRGVVAVAATSALLAALLSGVSATAQVHPEAWASARGAFLLAAVGAGLGALRETTSWQALLVAAGPRPAAAVPAAAAALVTLLAGGAVLLAGSLAAHGAAAADLARSLHGGGPGAVLLTLTGLGLTPNAAVFGATYATGPGFALGAHSLVSPFTVRLGPLPTLPMLAAVPSGTSWLGFATLGVPVLAGVAAGVVARRRAGTDDPLEAAVVGLAAGGLSGVGLGVAAWLAGGAAGPGRFAVVGASVWQVALAAAAEVGLVAAAAALGAPRRPDHHGRQQANRQVWLRAKRGIRVLGRRRSKVSVAPEE